MENDKKKMMWMFVGLCVAVVGLMVYLVVSLRNSSAVNYEVSAPRFAVESARRGVEIACAGQHNLVFYCYPELGGSGKLNTDRQENKAS